MKNVSIKLQQQRGFTLIEMMIVLVIIGVLAAVALPSYENSVLKGHRRTAQADLMAFSQAMEKEYALKFTYANATAGSTYPAISPNEGGDKRYDLSIPSKIADAYTLRATPAGSQAGDGYLEINHLGQKFWDKNNNNSIDAGENTWAD
jgi:type IV pilus assembly protein PilE